MPENLTTEASHQDLDQGITRLRSGPDTHTRHELSLLLQLSDGKETLCLRTPSPESPPVSVRQGTGKRVLIMYVLGVSTSGV